MVHVDFENFISEKIDSVYYHILSIIIIPPPLHRSIRHRWWLS